MSSSDQQAASLLGTVLEDAYRLTRLIGRGGMGTVYEGTQLRLNKRVAIKLLARELSTNQEALARFRREAEVTSQLGHPHIVQVFDFGTAPSGEPYLVMEYLEGEDLDARLRRVGRLPLATVVSIVKQVASALSSTHSRGIVHRDLKPANVFVLDVEGEADFVKVVDFGISKVRAASMKLTNSSAIIGTPNYMSPEQATGQIDEIDHRTDQWALACIAYEMLAGRGPFVGDTIHALLYQVIHQEPPALGAFAPSLRPAIEGAIRRALSKRQTDRFPTTNAFSRALAAAVDAPAVSVPEVAVPKPRDPESQAPALPKLTTLSRTASEMMTPLARLRGRFTPRRAAFAGAGAVVLVLIGVAVLRNARAPVAQFATPAATSTPTSPAPSVVPSIVVLPSAPPSRVPVVAPPPPAEPEALAPAVEPSKPARTIKAPPRRERALREPVKTDGHTSDAPSPVVAPPPAKPPSSNPSSPNPPSSNRKPTRRLIEDL